MEKKRIFRKFKTSFLGKNFLGFSLIEILVVIAILGAISVIATRFLFTTLSGSQKSEVTKEVRQNGEYVLSVIQTLVLGAKKITCPTTSEVDITDLWDQVSKIICVPNTSSGGVISSNSAALTGTNVTVTQCTFTCIENTGKATKLEVDFTISTPQSSGARASEKSSLRFQSSFIGENY